MSVRQNSSIKKDLQTFKDEIVQQFHLISGGLIDQIKLLAEGHSGMIQRFDRMETRLDGVETRLDRMETKFDHLEKRFDHLEKENERQHLETRSLVKISFSELDRRLSTLEVQMKEIQDWKKQIESRLQV